MTLHLLRGPFIQAGESLSDVLDCREGQPVRITMPGNWTGETTTPLTFQVSTDGAFFNDLFDHEGNEGEAVVMPGAGVVIPNEFFRSLNCYVKFRSGTSDGPVKQSELREFSVVLET
jgi:hypothetical protein